MKKVKTLKLNYEFKNVFDKGRYSLGSQVITHYRKNKLGHNRLGIGVSTKLAKAVKRNRVKRVIRNCYQKINKEYDGLANILVSPYILNTFNFIENKNQNDQSL